MAKDSPRITAGELQKIVESQGQKKIQDKKMLSSKHNPQYFQ